MGEEPPAVKACGQRSLQEGTTMPTRREFLTSGATLIATGTLLTEGLTSCATPEVQSPEPITQPAPEKPKPADDSQAFLELSALLTGLNEQLLNDQKLDATMGKEYYRRLEGTFPQQFPALLAAYKGYAEGYVAGNPAAKLDDAFLKKFCATEKFRTNEFVAKQIVLIWYFSQFKDKESSGTTIDGGFYERGYVWPLIKAPPIGFSNKRPGYWAADPTKETA